MASWHARASSDDGNSVEIVYHIPIPAVNNRVGVGYRTAIVGSGIGGRTSMTTGAAAGQISAAEATQIANGELYEHVESFNTHPGENAAAIQARIDARYTALVTELQAKFANRLAYWGHSRTVP